MWYVSAHHRNIVWLGVHRTDHLSHINLFVSFAKGVGVKKIELHHYGWTRIRKP